MQAVLALLIFFQELTIPKQFCEILSGQSHQNETMQQVKQLVEVYISTINASTKDILKKKSHLQLVTCDELIFVPRFTKTERMWHHITIKKKIGFCEKSFQDGKKTEKPLTTAQQNFKR